MSFIKIEINKKLNTEKFAANSIELSKQLAQQMYLHVMETFDQEGPGWKPLSNKTRKQRIKQGFGESPILDRKRGNLGLKGGIIEAPTPTEAVVGVRSGIPYARIHQLGGRITRVTNPGTVRLRTNKKGELIRQSKYPKLAVFARKKHKLAKEVNKSFGKRYSIYIPKRSYLVVNNNLINRLKQTAINFLNSK